MTAPTTPEQERVTNLESIMEQAQVFASAWSLVGGRFDFGDGLELAEQEKAELRGEVAAALEAGATQTVPASACQWISVDERLPGGLEHCDWLFPKSSLKHERWILCNECIVTASVPGNATHWRIAAKLPQLDGLAAQGGQHP